MNRNVRGHAIVLLSFFSLLALSLSCTAKPPSDLGGTGASTSASDPLSGSDATSSAGTSQLAASALTTPSALVSQQIQSVNTSLNAAPAYAISSADVQTLQASGVLSSDDQQLLNYFVQ